jgi:hypothetical protein
VHAQRFRDKLSNHVCWAGHKSKTYRLAFEVKATAVDKLDPLARVRTVCFLDYSRFAFLALIISRFSGIRRPAQARQLRQAD